MIGFSKKEKMMPAKRKIDGRKVQWTMERRLQHSRAMKKAWARKKGGLFYSIKRFFLGA